MNKNTCFSLEEIRDTAKWVEETFPDLNAAQHVWYAIEIQRNRMMGDFFVLTDSAPSALEAIAIALGYKK